MNLLLSNHYMAKKYLGHLTATQFTVLSLNICGLILLRKDIYPRIWYLDCSLYEFIRIKNVVYSYLS